MNRTLFLALALLASFAFSFAPSSAFAGYPTGADQTWEPWYTVDTDSATVSPDPIYRGNGDLAISGTIVRRDVESHYSGTTARMMPRNDLPRISPGEILWRIEMKTTQAPTGSLFYLDITTVDEQEFNSPFFTPTEEWKGFEFTVTSDSSLGVDKIDEITIFFISEWEEGGILEYEWSFDDLKYSRDGGLTWTVIESGGQPTPILGDIPTIPNAGTTALGTNYPNPFNPSTSIRYELAEESSVLLAVYDVAGQLVATLVSQSQPAGAHAVRWDGTNNAGFPVASGVYTARLKTDREEFGRHMLLTK